MSVVVEILWGPLTIASIAFLIWVLWNGSKRGRDA